MENISQFRYFLYKFIKFIIIVTIILYINRYIAEKSHNIKSYQYNRTMLYLFFLYLGIFISDIMTYESNYVTRMVYYIIFCVLSIYFLNWAIFKYMYYGFWYSFLISLGSTLLIGLIFMAAFIYGIHENWNIEKTLKKALPVHTTIGQPLANHWPAIGQPLGNHWPTIG